MECNQADTQHLELWSPGLSLLADTVHTGIPRGYTQGTARMELFEASVPRSRWILGWFAYGYGSDPA